MSLIGPPFFRPNAVREGFGYRVSGYVIALEAWRRGITVTLLDHHMRKFRLSDGAGNDMIFLGPRPVDSKNGIVRNKYRANQYLTDAGVPVPQSFEIDQSVMSVATLKELAEHVGYPVVLKPRDGALGKGVFANIRDAAQLEGCFSELVQLIPDSVLVLEEHVIGEDYRVLVYEDRYIAACKRIPANLTGDGVSTAAELIDAKNEIRSKNPHLSTGLIKKDFEVTEYLSRHGYSYDSVPYAGEYIQLRAAANASAGGDVVDVTEELPPHIQESAVRAVQCIPGLLCSGVDVLFDRATGEYHIIELNGLPQIAVNMYPSIGKGVDVPEKVIDLYFPNSSRSGFQSDAQLSLTVKPALKLIASGFASEVTMAPVPKSRYRTRLKYKVDGWESLTKSQRSKIARLAGEEKVVGFVRTRDDVKELVVAGSSSAVATFLHTLGSEFHVQLRDRRKWAGAVPSGFLGEK